MKIYILILLSLITLTIQGPYQKYYDEAYNIAVAMSLDQKIGQTIQADFYSITTSRNVTEASEAAKYHFGSLLVGGDGAPNAEGNIVNIPDNDEKK